VTMVQGAMRFALRWLLIPAAVAVLFLGVTSDGHRTARLTPKPATIAAGLSTHHDLPKGTRLALGDPPKQTTITYNAHGRVAVKQPRGETFATVLERGCGELGKLLSTVGVNVARATTADSAAPTATSKR